MDSPRALQKTKVFGYSSFRAKTQKGGAQSKTKTNPVPKTASAKEEFIPE